MLLLGTAATAQQTGDAPAPSIWDNALALTMLIISLVLLLVIALLANVVLGTAKLLYCSWHRLYCRRRKQLPKLQQLLHHHQLVV
jgi:hypothetical protein